MARLLFGLGVAAVIFMVYAVADCAFFDRTRVRGLSRGWWIVVILFVPVIGAALWFLIGRGRARRIPAGRSREVAPDDDTDFLRRLQNDAAQDERIRRLEQELAELDADEPGAAGTGDTGGPEASGDALGTERQRPDTPETPGESGPSGRPNG
ncbi:PLDc N-terminal domain-containing protein [Agromyces sp. ISL-38]|uniref:PLD nuclease N-terminal domain-containing protein n=1 Tax=Agromyces sp. ISL-38 TaxID=2819107 RepID=UPI001BECD25D|nr:PLD nuclease N-terminal domain-containing protein [Agromyces sp. ISL-38]MBT2500727.1 PLDc N-terminal domain-containing protein [Agromyces sp. ISL-38]MBT2516676.1 PLDc N-terminal domain-containing protein [Streptomyces sp. ISL-90]